MGKSSVFTNTVHEGKGQKKNQAMPGWVLQRGAFVVKNKTFSFLI